MTSFFSLNAALPQASDVDPRRDHNSFSNLQRPAFPYESDPVHHPRSAHGKARNSMGANGDAAIPVPQPTNYAKGSHHGGNATGGRSPFDLGRSPPNPSNKNTKHVPCKFFRQGTCQAGNACPFSHSMDPVTTTQPCKYFMKGTCKFGAKCALAHIYADGTLANRPNVALNLGRNGGPYVSGQRTAPPNFQNQDPTFSNSLLTQQQRQYQIDPYSSQYPYLEQEEPDAFYDRYAQYRNGRSETGFISPSGSHFGSPSDEAQFPKSPVENLHTALNAPLPQSFDPNGLSHIAKYGPLGQSVPDKFGMKSPPASLPKKTNGPLETLINTRSSAFGSNLQSGLLLGSSPHVPDESIGQRIMHSQRPVRSNRLSASVPQGGPLDDWDDNDNFSFEQDLLPNSVRDEVLTPQEKMRRISRPEQDLGLAKDQANALAIPSGSSSKVGSPSMAGSPSRYRAIFEQQQQQREKREHDATNPNGVSAFGHVGSPLRESWMANGAVSTSPRNSSLSGISQQMARIQLSRTESSESSNGKLQPSGLRHTSAPVGRFDRTISSPGISSTRIDEETESLVFSMDEENGKRSSTNWEGRSPRLVPMSDTSNPTRPIDIRESVPSHISSAKGTYGFRP